jgi:SAM-dependent methyltransferase
MKADLLPRLASPCCGAALTLDALERAGDDVESGTLRCSRCAAGFPIERGVPRLLPPDLDGGRQVQRSFEFQWATWGDETRIFGRTRQDALDYFFANLVHPDVGAGDLRGKWVLDAGCGHGMYVACLAELGANVVGLDVTGAVEPVYRRVRGRPNAHCVQGDVLRPPFRPGAFDVVFSNGVLHHTADTRRAFAAISALAGAPGYAGIWLYPVTHPAWEWTQRAIRTITTRMPRALLHPLCYLAVPLLSVARAYSGTSLATASWRQCAQVIFDFYAPRYQWHHRRDEVERWFREEGFGDVRFMPDPLSVTGKRGAR